MYLNSFVCTCKRNTNPMHFISNLKNDAVYLRTSINFVEIELTFLISDDCVSEIFCVALQSKYKFYKPQTITMHCHHIDTSIQNFSSIG